MSKKDRDRIPEDKILKALADLEEVTKADPLEDQDPEGGLSAEGKPLSDKAPRGRGEQTRKSRRASASSPFGGASSSSSSASSDDDDDGSDDASSPLMPPKRDKKKDKKGGKVSKASRAASSESSDDGSSDDDSDDADKSFREMADGDETMSKGILVNQFLESMTDQLSLALLHVKESLAKSFAKELARVEGRLGARIDEHFAKSFGGRREFDVRLAKGMAAIGNIVVNELRPMADMVKSLADQPAGSPRGKAVLSKGEVNKPPWSGPQSVNDDERLAAGSEGDYIEELREVPTSRINDWLFKKSATNQLDPNVPIAFEADRYDPAMLPPAVRKALYDDLIK